MKVELMSYTPDAMNLLLRTKNTRLGSADDPATWDEPKKLANLEYMLGTIKSSWEFVDYTFLITGVTRAFTHQLVRTRSGSYAQQSQRVVDAREHEVIEPDGIDFAAKAHWERETQHILRAYGMFIDDGMAVQDARGLLPTNIATDIFAKFSLRTLHDMAKVRLCTRTQGEYQNVFRQMRERVLEVHPWAFHFINVQCVADGTCAFPNYGPTKCLVWDPVLDRTAAKELMTKRFWEVRHESDPTK